MRRNIAGAPLGRVVFARPLYLHSDDLPLGRPLDFKRKLRVASERRYCALVAAALGPLDHIRLAAVRNLFAVERKYGSGAPLAALLADDRERIPVVGFLRTGHFFVYSADIGGVGKRNPYHLVHRSGEIQLADVIKLGVFPRGVISLFNPREKIHESVSLLAPRLAVGQVG